MAKSTGRGAGIQALAVLKHRLAEAFGFALLLACFLLFLSLFTYDPRDGSLNTAVDAAPHNFLGHDGAILGYGSAMFYLPSRRATIVVLGNNNDLGNPRPLNILIALSAYLFPRQFPHGV